MTHRLDRLELEIQVAEEALARPLQDRLSRLHHQTLADLLGRVLDELSPPGRLHRLESLELDLGEIPEEQLERLLPQRLEQALRQALPEQPPTTLLSDPQGGGAPGEERPSDTLAVHEGLAVDQALELLAVYAISGRLPWWAPRESPGLIPVALEAALSLAAEALVAWWRQALPNTTARQRLLAAAQQEQAARLLQLVGDGVVMGNEVWGTQRASDASDRATRPEAVETTMAAEFLELARGSAAMEPAAVAELLDPAGGGELMRPAAEPDRRASSEGGDGLQPPSAVQGVASDGLPPAAAAQRPSLDSLGPDRWPVTALELLLAYASTGRLPDGLSTQAEQLIPQAIEVALNRPAAELAAWWRQTLPDDSARQRLLLTSHPQQALRLRQLEAPLAPMATLPTYAPDAPDDPISVDGAGLVLLTPFLETLFNRLELLTPELQFQGADAAQRAMALLGWLVDGDPQPPEWRLTLATALSGWPLEQLYALEKPLSETDQEEAERLLLAALAHGQGQLGETIEQLRQNWLRRPGLLSWRPGAWLLLVEHREGDEALEELPWSWGWIRLPWMEELLQVVW
ncbi:MAG: contractile injection system tape measure protein [Synechococcaceae cyanobacterium]